MHDIDTTRLEMGGDSWEASESSEQEWSEELSGDFEAVLDDGEVEELAAELMGVNSEEELDQFLGGFLKKLRSKASSVGRLLARAGGPVLGTLKGLAKQALPFVGGALGSAIPIPGVGTAIGTALGNAAANALESELQSENQEERDFEMAERFVRVADEAVVTASRQSHTRNSRAVIHSLRRALARLRAQLRRQRRFRPCPPCPSCQQAATAVGTDASASDAKTSAGDQDAGGGDAKASGDQASEWGFEEEALERRRRRRRPRRSGWRGMRMSSEPDDDADDYGDDSSEEEFAGEAFESSSSSRGGRARTGRWVRRGTKIVLLGV